MGESLTLHTQGGAEKLKDLPCSKTLRNFLASIAQTGKKKVRVRPVGFRERNLRISNNLLDPVNQLEGETPVENSAIDESRLEIRQERRPRRRRPPVGTRIQTALEDQLMDYDESSSNESIDENENEQGNGEAEQNAEPQVEENVDLGNNETIVEPDGNIEQNLVPENESEEETDEEIFSRDFIGPLQSIPEGNEEENNDLGSELENFFGNPRNLPSDDILLTGIENLDEKEYELDIREITTIDEIKR